MKHFEAICEEEFCGVMLKKSDKKKERYALTAVRVHVYVHMIQYIIQQLLKLRAVHERIACPLYIHVHVLGTVYRKMSYCYMGSWQ